MLRITRGAGKWREIERASYPTRIVARAVFIHAEGDVYFPRERERQVASHAIS